MLLPVIENSITSIACFSRIETVKAYQPLAQGAMVGDGEEEEGRPAAMMVMTAVGEPAAGWGPGN
jgi:hypothetical protein